MKAAISDPAVKHADQSQQAGEASIHPLVVKIAIGAVLWFLAVTWIAFAGRSGVE